MTNNPAEGGYVDKKWTVAELLTDISDNEFMDMVKGKCSNHRKVPKHNRHHTIDYFEPHRKLIMAMQKEERNYEHVNPKAKIKLARMEKKWTNLVAKLKRLLGG